MRKILLLLPISFILCVSIAIAQASGVDMYPLSRSDLEQFSKDVESVQRQYHTHLDSNERDEVLSAVQKISETYLHDNGLTKASWPWFDYTYERKWNLLSVETEVEVTDANTEKHSYQVYGEVFPFNEAYELVYLCLNDTEIINRRQELPNPLWANIETHFVNTRTDLDLTVLSLEQLDSLGQEIETALSDNHSVSSKAETAVHKIVEESVNNHFTKQGYTVTWPWFDYSYTCDWDLYTETTEVTCRDGNNKRISFDIYAEVYNNGTTYELIYLLIDENAVVDLRNQVRGKSYQVYQSSILYANAQSLFIEGKYAEAQEIFLSIGDFSNSRSMAYQCTEYLMGSEYAKATVLFDNGRYEEAMYAFLSLGNHGDSVEKAKLCQDKLNQIKYSDACSLMQDGQYDLALPLFETLGDYADSTKLADECAQIIIEAKYQNACDLRDQGLYMQALSIFSELGTYKESVDQVIFCKDSENQKQYQAAKSSMDAGEYNNALTILSALGDYLDVQVLIATCHERISEATYAKASLMKAGGHFDEAYDLFVSLGEYANSAEMAEGCLTSKANIDRKICYPEEEIIIFLSKSVRLTPTIKRLTETAPETSKVIYHSSDSAIARVSKEGTITSVKEGTTTILCSTEDNPDNITELIIHVVLPVKSVKFETSSLTIMMDANNPAACEVELQAIISPETAHDQSLTWTSSNEKVATVDAKGKIIPVGPGSTTITATANDKTNGVRKATCTVRVKMAVTEITLNKQEGIVFIGQSETLKASVLPENAADKSITWSSSDKSIATVSSTGVVKGISTGTATITATTSSGLESSFIATVKQGPATFTVSIKATRIATNHVGSNWKTSFEVDDKTFSGSTTFTAELDQVVNISGEISENDSNPDYGWFNVPLTMTEDIFKNGYSEERTVYVRENGGRYSGNQAEWRVVISVKKRQQ